MKLHEKQKPGSSFLLLEIRAFLCKKTTGSVGGFDFLHYIPASVSIR